jgi:hypothetical protein
VSTTYQSTLAEIVLDLFQTLPAREKVLVGKKIIGEIGYKSWDTLTWPFKKSAQQKNLSEKDILNSVLKDRYGKTS